jgi:hypothetical protein
MAKLRTRSFDMTLLSARFDDVDRTVTAHRSALTRDDRQFLI